MKKDLVGIFFGSDTGNTEKIAKMIHVKLGKDLSSIFDVSSISKKNVEDYNKLIFGIPTWYYGEPQCDWDEFLPVLKKINFHTKTVAIFGCGDQEDYSEYFCDAMSILHKIILKNGATVVGSWSTSGYHFDESKSIINNNEFLGLTIDEDRQSELTKNRVYTWIDKIIQEMNFNKK